MTPEERIRNVALVVLSQTEVRRRYNGTQRPAVYAAPVDAIAGSSRQLAEMILSYLDGRLGEEKDDNSPF